MFGTVLHSSLLLRFLEITLVAKRFQTGRADEIFHMIVNIFVVAFELNLTIKHFMADQTLVFLQLLMNSLRVIP